MCVCVCVCVCLCTGCIHLYNLYILPVDFESMGISGGMYLNVVIVVCFVASVMLSLFIFLFFICT